MADYPYSIGDLVELSEFMDSLRFDKFDKCEHGIVIGYGNSRKYINYLIFWFPLNSTYHHKGEDLCLLSKGAI